MSVAAAALLSSCTKVIGDGPMVTQTRNVAHFNGIDLRMSGAVHFQQAPEYKVEVRAQDEILPVLHTYVQDGRLVIRFNNNATVRVHDGVVINVWAPELKSLRVGASGDINCKGNLVTPSLELDVNASGDINLSHLTTAALDAEIGGSGNITVLSGTVTEEKLRVGASGSINLAGLAAQKASTRTSGSGATRVKVSDHLDVTINGSGSVYYSGNPVVNASISGSGRVRKQ